ncbi:MAG: LexA family transcriptional regulator [Oceanibaculum nanhaiense]|jgi:phage repressor protein C with HTH and peptisase S24 domain|uniref:LexA family transcriptional regulator n=1 Tax=Oceanibaculum nanhaiense TaxID=1909734 RepID=UPI0032EC1427
MAAQTHLQRAIKNRLTLLNKSARQVSLDAGLNETFVKSILLGRSKNPRQDTLRQLAKVLGCTVPDLIGDTGEQDNSKLPDQLPGYNGKLKPSVISIGDEEYAAVGRFDARLSAGPGSFVIEGEQPEGYQLFEAQWLRAITTTAPDRLAVLRVDGDSMENTLSDRDFVLVDRSQNRFGKEGIYALRVGDNCWVKRLSLNLRDRLIRIISDNPRYPVQELPEEEIDLIGRVVWIVGRKV